MATNPLSASSDIRPTAIAVEGSPFNLVLYNGWQLMADAYSSSFGSSATAQSYGWGYSTGAYSAFLTSSKTGTRTAPINLSTGSPTHDFFSPVMVGESYGTGTALVNPTADGLLSGSMTFNGVNSSGSRFSLGGDVKIDQSTGKIIYDYTGTWSDAATGTVDRGTGSGTMTLYYGQYFQQASIGTITTTTANNTNYVTNDGQFKGTRFDLAVNNGAPQNFNAAFSINVDQGNPGTQSMIMYSQGVISKDGGTVSGGMTTYALDSSGNIVRMSGPVFVEADGKTTTAWLLGGDDTNVIKGLWVQSTDPNATLVTQTFEGTFDITTSS
ncbi:MAG TPA: hypothetical protein VE082_07935, partial [Desulfobaccales bacterium]|nr:hypothetical protein [Desulfobaccales bacterium]